MGLVVHKLVWEVMKRRDTRPQPDPAPPSPATRLVKWFKMAVLAGIILQTLFLPNFPPILRDPLPLQVVGALLYLAGLSVAIAGRLYLGDNWVDLEDYQVIPEQSLVTRGIYQYIRHPIYGGDILLLLGLELALNSWLVLGIIPLTAVVIRQARAEERVLSRAFPGYAGYQQRTKMLIPFVL